VATTAYCAGCGEAQPVDAHWRGLRIDCYGVRISNPFLPELGMSYDALCCGQGSALILVERWLHTGTFVPAQAHITQPEPEGDPAR
jgi:hypothetical protein